MTAQMMTASAVQAPCHCHREMRRWIRGGKTARLATAPREERAIARPRNRNEPECNECCSDEGQSALPQRSNGGEPGVELYGAVHLAHPQRGEAEQDPHSDHEDPRPVPVQHAAHKDHARGGGQRTCGVHPRDECPRPRGVVDDGVDEYGDGVGLPRPGDEQRHAGNRKNNPAVEEGKANSQGGSARRGTGSTHAPAL